MILIQRRSIEDPRESIADWEEDSGLFADTGEKVDRKQAMKSSLVWGAVNLVARTVAKIPCRTYVRINEGKERATSHPVYSLLRYKPNPDQTAFYFWQTALGQCLLSPGNSYSYIERTPKGAVSTLRMLDPEAVTPVRMDGRLWYVINGGDNFNTRVDSSQILHLKGPGYNGLTGYSVLEYARNSIGMSLAAQKYSNKYFANNAEPRVILEHPEWMTQEQANAVKAGWDSMHKGLDKVHGTAVLQGGMKAHPLTISAKDSQLIESMNFSVRDVANWFGCPPHKIGDSSRTAYNSLEQENQSMLSDTIDPWLVMIEQECRDKLLSEAEKRTDSHVIEFDRGALVRADITSRGNYYKAALSGMPWETINEVRRRENLNTLDGFDNVLIPGNIGSDKPNEEPPAETNARGKEEARQCVDDIRKRMEKRLRFNYDKALRKNTTQTKEQLFSSVCDEHEQVMRDALNPALKTLCAITGEPLEDRMDATINQIREVTYE